jgi:polar amino acid transport system substrate-binding protein
MKTTKLVSLAVTMALLVAACGSDDEAETTTDDASAGGSETAGDDATATSEDAGETGDAATDDTVADDTVADDTAAEGSCDPLPTVADGVLTVATGDVVFEPWMVDDDPTNEMGFESAVVYALAAEVGVGEIEWVRTTFDEAIAPGQKDYDFNIQQYSITDERDEVVDFSDGYYQVEQALVGAADGSLAGAASLADLADAKLGAAIATTSLTYIEDVIQPTELPAVFDDNAAAKSAFDAGQVDGLVFDLPTAYFITAVEIPDASIIGVLPRAGDPEELGMLFEDGSPLVPCVNEALAALTSAGTIEALEEEWLNQAGSIPTLTE